MTLPHIFTPITYAIDDWTFGPICTEPKDRWTAYKARARESYPPAMDQYYNWYDWAVLSGGDGDRLVFGVCCRKSLTLTFDYHLAGDDESATFGYKITTYSPASLDPPTGATTVWASTPGIVHEQVDTVTVPIIPNACGVAILIESIGDAINSKARISISV